LPDGTRSHIPASWTDLASPGNRPSDDETFLLAFLPDLLRTRQRVDALLHRIGTTPINTTASTQENQRASQSTGTLVRGAAPGSAHLLPTQPPAAEPPHLSSGVPNAKAGPQPNHKTSPNPGQSA